MCGVTGRDGGAGLRRAAKPLRGQEPVLPVLRVLHLRDLRGVAQHQQGDPRGHRESRRFPQSAFFSPLGADPVMISTRFL